MSLLERLAEGTTIGASKAIEAPLSNGTASRKAQAIVNRLSRENPNAPDFELREVFKKIVDQDETLRGLEYPWSRTNRDASGGRRRRRGTSPRRRSRRGTENNGLPASARACRRCLAPGAHSASSTALAS